MGEASKITYLIGVGLGFKFDRFGEVFESLGGSLRVSGGAVGSSCGG